MLHRYLVVHTELRPIIACSDTIDALLEACQLCRQMVKESGNELSMYSVSWYNRYRLERNDSNGCTVNKNILANMNPFKTSLVHQTGHSENDEGSLCGLLYGDQ